MFGRSLKGAAMRRRDFIKVVDSVALWPLVAHAQQPATPVIGFLSSRSPDESKHMLAEKRA
jgi:putative ABC transport system substrate-binding protein